VNYCLIADHEKNQDLKRRKDTADQMRYFDKVHVKATKNWKHIEVLETSCHNMKTAVQVLIHTNQLNYIISLQSEQDKKQALKESKIKLGSPINSKFRKQNFDASTQRHNQSFIEG
jgi:hypothetical protein